MAALSRAALTAAADAPPAVMAWISLVLAATQLPSSICPTLSFWIASLCWSEPTFRFTPRRGRAKLSAHLTNAFKQAGGGLGPTFPAAFPPVRIDHVWLRQAEAVRAFMPVSTASDHRPLVVEVHLP